MKNFNSKFFRLLMYFLRRGLHSHMLQSLSNDEFQLKLVHQKHPKWTENDISLFKEMDILMKGEKHLNHLNYNESCRVRFKANLRKCVISDCLKLLGTTKEKGITKLHYKLLKNLDSSELGDIKDNLISAVCTSDMQMPFNNIEESGSHFLCLSENIMMNKTSEKALDASHGGVLKENKMSLNNDTNADGVLPLTGICFLAMNSTPGEVLKENEVIVMNLIQGGVPEVNEISLVDTTHGDLKENEMILMDTTHRVVLKENEISLMDTTHGVVLKGNEMALNNESTIADRFSTSMTLAMDTTHGKVLKGNEAIVMDLIQGGVPEVNEISLVDTTHGDLKENEMILMDTTHGVVLKENEISLMDTTHGVVLKGNEMALNNESGIAQGQSTVINHHFLNLDTVNIDSTHSWLRMEDEMSLNNETWNSISKYILFEEIDELKSMENPFLPNICSSNDDNHQNLNDDNYQYSFDGSMFDDFNHV